MYYLDDIRTLEENVQRYFNKEEVTIVVFFDIGKAFNKIWHKYSTSYTNPSNLKRKSGVQSLKLNPLLF